MKELHVIITDNKGHHSLEDIKQDEIQLTEDGAPQTIQSLTLRELPVRYGLVIDSSGSLRSQFPRIIEAARSIVAANRPDDEAFIVRFVSSSQINTMQETTSDKSQLMAALSLLRVAPGQTAVIDALYLSAQELLKAGDAKGRQALILISDGEDRASFYKQDDLFKLLQKGNFRVFVIGLVKELSSEGGLIRKAPRELAVRLIERLTKETGGRAFYPQKTEDLPSAVTEIIRDLHLQYVVKYRSTNVTKKSHDLEIKVSDNPDKKKRRAILKPRYKAEELESVEK